MNFRKIFEGGGVVSDPKNFVSKFLALETPIWGVISVPKKFVEKNRNIFPNKGGSIHSKSEKVCGVCFSVTKKSAEKVRKSRHENFATKVRKSIKV